jgi:plasmid stabilization system protein ParE
MPQVKWSKRSLQDLDRLITFLSSSDADLAAKAVQKWVAAAVLIGKYPMIGKSFNDGTDRREYVIPFGKGAYVIRYRYNDEQLAILRVFHSAEDRFGEADS